MTELYKSIKNLKNNEGITFKNGKAISYKSGWQVATNGYEVATPKEAKTLIQKLKNCGIWYSEGIYYIDSCKRVNTRQEAMKIGIENNQQSIFCWRTGKLAWC